MSSLATPSGTATSPPQASSRAATQGAAATPPTASKASLGKAMAPDPVEVQRILSSAGCDNDSDPSNPPSTVAGVRRSKSMAPSSPDTDSDGATSSPVPHTIGLPAGTNNLASISEAEGATDEVDSDDDDELDDDDPNDHDNEQAIRSNEQVLWSGYLEKKGIRRKAWKKRWFVLRKTSLVYYKSHKEYRLLRMIPLPDIHTCASVQVKQHDNTFGIVTPKRTFYVRAKSQADVDAWIKAVAAAREELKHAQLESASVEGSGSGLATPTGRALSRSSPQLTERLNSSSSGRAALPIDIPQSSSLTSQNPSSSLQPGLGPTTLHDLSSSYASQSSSGLAGPTAAMVREVEVSDGERRSEKVPFVDQGPLHGGSFSGASSTGDGARYLGALQGRSSLSKKGVVSRTVVTSSEDEEEIDALPDVTWASERRPPVQAPEEGKTIIQGYLMKHGKRRGWRKRWFVLTSKGLSYARSHMDKHAKSLRHISIDRILDGIEYDPSAASQSSALSTSSAPTSPLTGQFHLPSTSGPSHRTSEEQGRHGFKIITSQRTYLVSAPTEEDEIRWLSAIRCLLASRRGSCTTGASSESPLNVNVSPPLSLGGAGVSGLASLPPCATSPPQPTQIPLQPPVPCTSQPQRQPSNSALPSIESTLNAGTMSGNMTSERRSRGGSTGSNSNKGSSLGIVQMMDAPPRIQAATVQG